MWEIIKDAFRWLTANKSRADFAAITDKSLEVMKEINDLRKETQLRLDNVEVKLTESNERLDRHKKRADDFEEKLKKCYEEFDAFRKKN